MAGLWHCFSHMTDVNGFHIVPLFPRRRCDTWPMSDSCSLLFTRFAARVILFQVLEAAQVCTSYVTQCVSLPKLLKIYQVIWSHHGSCRLLIKFSFPKNHPFFPCLVGRLSPRPWERSVSQASSTRDAQHHALLKPYWQAREWTVKETTVKWRSIHHDILWSTFTQLLKIT